MVCKMSDCFEISVDELLGRSNCLLLEEAKYSEKSMKQLDFDLEKIESAQRVVLQIYFMIKA